MKASPVFYLGLNNQCLASVVVITFALHAKGRGFDPRVELEKQKFTIVFFSSASGWERGLSQCPLLRLRAEEEALLMLPMPPPLPPMYIVPRGKIAFWASPWERSRCGSIDFFKSN